VGKAIIFQSPQRRKSVLPSSFNPVKKGKKRKRKKRKLNSSDIPSLGQKGRLKRRPSFIAEACRGKSPTEEEKKTRTVTRRNIVEWEKRYPYPRTAIFKRKASSVS